MKVNHVVIVNAADPAASTIAGDIRSLGGVPVVGSPWWFSFETEAARNQALAEIRGCFGTRSVQAEDLSQDSQEKAQQGRPGRSSIDTPPHPGSSITAC